MPPRAAAAARGRAAVREMPLRSEASPTRESDAVTAPVLRARRMPCPSIRAFLRRRDLASDATTSLPLRRRGVTRRHFDLPAAAMLNFIESASAEGDYFNSCSLSF